MTEDIKSLLQKNCHQVAPEELSPGDKVWIPDQRKEGKIIQTHEAPRSVLIDISDGGLLRRNRQMARKLHMPTGPPDTVKDSSASPMPADASPNLDADRSADQSSAFHSRATTSSGSCQASADPTTTCTQKMQ